MTVSLNKLFISSRKGILFNDNSPAFDDSEGAVGWGTDILLSGFHTTSPPTREVTFKATLTTYSKTYELDAVSLCSLGVFGTSSVPLTSQNQIQFYLVLNSSDALEVVKASSFDEDSVKNFPDGVLEIEYEITDPGESDLLYTESFKNSVNAQYVIDQKAINLDLKFFNNKSDIRELLDVIVLEGLMYLVENSYLESKTETINRALNTIANEENEYYND